MSDWQPIPRADLADRTTLQGDEVHVWLFESADTVPLTEGQIAVLSPHERERGARFRRESDRHAYLQQRFLLRTLLSGYLGLPRSDIAYTQNETGKPALDPQLSRELRFNLSHSGQTALMAFALGRRIGIDLEQPRPDTDHLKIARRFFSEEESRSLAAAPPEAQPALFTRIWTRKEAVIKAVGLGLSMPLNGFSVPLADLPPGASLAGQFVPDDPTEWRFIGLSHRWTKS